MNELSRRLDSFCARHSRKGIPNLMLYIAIGNLIVYILTLIDPSYTVYRLVCFNREAILQGQLWRLVTFLFATAGAASALDMLLTLISLYYYYRIGAMVERQVGTLKFNLFYFTGAIMMLALGMLTGGFVSADSLNLTLLLLFAIFYSEAQILLFMVIPIKVRYVAWVYLALMVFSCMVNFSLLPLIPLAPLALFFWNELPNLLPIQWQVRLARRPRAKEPPRPKAGPNWAEGYRNKSGQRSYHHKCVVCGRTDVDSPGLDFRYCSRCSGYRCYCMEHINDHAHIVDTQYEKIA